MKLRLVVLSPGPSQGKLIPITGAQFVIGREPGCQLRPASILISNRHCALVRRDEKAFVRDLGSTNGTFVNDRQIKGEFELRDGDQLRVGPLSFAVQLEPAPVTQPTLTPKQATDPSTTPPAEEPASAVGDGEAAAARLLAMQDEDNPESVPHTEVPEGNTVFEMPGTKKPEKEMPK
jgi:pSer/pThr/pTyr-binding forkhead associated (FHA) protein